MNYPLEIERRPRQRTINVMVKPSGTVKVTAGRRVPMGDIRKFLMGCTDWIESVQADYEKVRKKHPPKFYFQGEPFLYLGRNRFLDFRKSYRKKLQFEVFGKELRCFVPQDQWSGSFHRGPQPGVAPLLRKFYEQKGREVLASRVQVWSDRLSLYPRSVSYRSQKTRWGSCNSRGDLSLNWRLILAPLPVLDYVVIHELCHIRHPNHSEDFWALVRAHAPGFKEHKKWLSQHHYDFDFLAKRPELY